MQLIPSNNLLTPLRTVYGGDDKFSFVGRKDVSEDGFQSYLENYLDDTASVNINGYSCLYLSKKTNAEDIFNIEKANKTSATRLCTNLRILDSDNVIIFSEKSQFGDNSNKCEIVNRNLIKEKDKTNAIVEIDFADNNTITISHIDNGIRKYLSLYGTIQSGSTRFKFSPLSDLPSEDQTFFYKFGYNVDIELGRLLIFVNGTEDNQYIIKEDNGSLLLKALADNEPYESCYFSINYYFDYPQPKLDKSWVSYSKTALNKHKIDLDKSINSLPNNYLVHTQYSNVSSDYLEANILTLKNQHTHKDISYRSSYSELTDNLYPNVDCRNYVGMMTGNKQEGALNSIGLSYEFYSIDYNFRKDKYTGFKTLDSLYPFENLNINDTNFVKCGAIAGDSPYNSDKVFKLVSNNYDESLYTCTWLSAGNNNDYLWVDRYFKPTTSGGFTQLESYLNSVIAQSAYYNPHFLYNTIEEEYQNSPQSTIDRLSGYKFFDKPSDLSFQPNSDYIYFRIGNAYVKKYLDTVNDNLLLSSFYIKTNSGVLQTNIEYTTYTFNGNGYVTFDKYEPINKSHQYTILFWLKSSDWTKGFGYQIFGNLNTNGIGLLSDRKITPFIMVQDKGDVHIFNTNFDKLDVAATKLDKRIYELYRTDHLSPFYTIIQ